MTYWSAINCHVDTERYLTERSPEIVSGDAEAEPAEAGDDAPADDAEAAPAETGNDAPAEPQKSEAEDGKGCVVM